MAGKRIGYYDIAKGIGIFCVVYAHAKAPFNKYMYLYHEEITVSNVLSYYPIHSTSGGLWWAAYTLVGLFVPILWGKLLRLGPWGKLLKRLHIV